MKTPKIAIIVPFIRLNDYVLECIGMCLRQSYGNFILVLLPDSKIRLEERYHDRRIKIITTGKCTIARKRNIGISENLDADYFAFIDSDAYPEKEWLSNAIKPFLKYKDIGAVGGPNLSPKNEDIMMKAVGNALKSFLVNGKYAYRKRLSDSRFCILLPGCNLIVKKSIFIEYGMFNSKLVTAEDIALCNKIISWGKKIFFEGGAVVYHHNRSLFLPFFFQRMAYGYSVIKLSKENHKLSNLYFFIPFIIVSCAASITVLAIFNRFFFITWLILFFTYILIAISEAINNSECANEILLTFIAIIIGNITPGIGTFLELFNIKWDIKKRYANI